MPAAARLQMSVKLLNEEDAFQDVIPVRILVSPEVVAAYGQAQPEAKEALDGGRRALVRRVRLGTFLDGHGGIGRGAHLADYPCPAARSSGLPARSPSWPTPSACRGSNPESSSRP